MLNSPANLFASAPPWLSDRLVTFQVGGSHAYGMATDESDVDYRGICVPPKEYYLDPFQRFEQFESHHPDVTVFSISKFFALAAECNPNVIEILFVDEKSCFPSRWFPESAFRPVLDETWKYLRRNRHLFLSSRAAYSFSGYAMAQLKRIRTHRAWLLNPPSHRPTREEFELDDAGMTGSTVGAINKTESAERSFSGPVMDLYRKEQSYANAVKHWEQYQHWCKSRNPTRAEAEQRFGYDTKHAAHLVRLLRMGQEILTTGNVIVMRPDAQELLEIRSGAWTYDELLTWAERMDETVRNLAQTTKLPHAQSLKQTLGSLHMRIVETVNQP